MEPYIVYGFLWRNAFKCKMVNLKVGKVTINESVKYGEQIVYSFILESANLKISYRNLIQLLKMKSNVTDTYLLANYYDDGPTNLNYGNREIGKMLQKAL